MIYVGAAEWKKSPKGRKSYAHMVAKLGPLSDAIRQFAKETR